MFLFPEGSGDPSRCGTYNRQPARLQSIDLSKHFSDSRPDPSNVLLYFVLKEGIRNEDQVGECMSSTEIILTDESRIRELVENWAQAVRSRDLDGILKQHAPDLLLFDVPLPVQSKGIGAYRQSWDLFYRWFGHSGRFELSELNVTAADSLAFCTALIRCAGSDASGATEELAVRLTVCYRKIDAQWVVVHEHHSVASGD